MPAFSQVFRQEALMGDIDENQKGTAERGRQKKLTTICDKRPGETQ